MLSETTTRVPKNTARAVNERIRRLTEAYVAHYSRHPEEIDRRLRELDSEWDIERTLQANAASVSLIGLGLAATASRRWLLLPVAVAGFLLQHALRGWCPPVPLFRRMGVRTAEEIARERYALKLIRGDFEGWDIGAGDDYARALAALKAAEPASGRSSLFDSGPAAETEAPVAATVPTDAAAPAAPEQPAPDGADRATRTRPRFPRRLWPNA